MEQWIEAAREGSLEALGLSLQACRQYLLLIANQELKADLRAKVSPSDLVQDTFVKAHKEFGRFHGHSEEELKAWLRCILLNVLSNARRHYQSTEKRKLGLEVPLEWEPAEPGRAPALPAPTTPPPIEVIAREEAGALQRALDALPDHYRQVIVWRYWERRKFEWIGRRLGRSPEAARKIWGRAVEQLSQLVEPPYEPG